LCFRPSLSLSHFHSSFSSLSCLSFKTLFRIFLFLRCHCCTTRHTQKNFCPQCHNNSFSSLSHSL
jgi:hypothetical protein